MDCKATSIVFYNRITECVDKYYTNEMALPSSKLNKDFVQLTGEFNAHFLSMIISCFELD